MGKRTPRQAVEALIAQIERDAQKKTPPLDPDITQMLRRELGLRVDPLARERSGAWGSLASKPLCAQSAQAQVRYLDDIQHLRWISDAAASGNAPAIFPQLIPAELTTGDGASDVTRSPRRSPSLLVLRSICKFNVEVRHPGF